MKPLHFGDINVSFQATGLSADVRQVKVCYQEAPIDTKMTSILSFQIMLRKGKMEDFMSWEDDYMRVAYSFFHSQMRLHFA